MSRPHVQNLCRIVLTALNVLYGCAVASDPKKGGSPRDHSLPGDVIPSLMDVLSEAVEDAGKDYADLLPLMRKDNGDAPTPVTIKRYLAGSHFPTGRGIDQWSRAVATVTGAKDRLRFFRTALEQAEAEERSGKAVGAARKARRQPQRKSPGTQRPRPS